MIQRRVLFSALLLTVTACSGVDSNRAGGGFAGGGGAVTGGGGKGGTGGGGTGGGGTTECVETPSVLEPSAVTSLGFSANDVLSLAGGVHDSALVWITSSGGYATNSRAGTQTLLTLAFAATPTAVRFVDSQGGGCIGQSGPCLVCRARMEIDVLLDVVTADSALNEELTVTLKAYAKDAPTFTGDIAAAMMTGNYLDGVTPQTGYEISGAHLEAGWGVGFSGSRTTVPNAWNGFVVALLNQIGSSSAISIMQAHGYFPPETAGL